MLASYAFLSQSIVRMKVAQRFQMVPSLEPVRHEILCSISPKNPRENSISVLLHSICALVLVISSQCLAEMSVQGLNDIISLWPFHICHSTEEF
jgi:hypothetical protein